jgi:hypothetical protein
MNRRALLANGSLALTTFTALAGCTESTPRPDTVTLEIETEDSWSGITRTDGGWKNIDGRGDETIEWTQPLPSNIRATIKKGPRRDTPLEATFYADGEEKRTKSTTEPYESVILTLTPGPGD